jgi:hypothetical protein
MGKAMWPEEELKDLSVRRYMCCSTAILGVYSSCVVNPLPGNG